MPKKTKEKPANEVKSAPVEVPKVQYTGLEPIRFKLRNAKIIKLGDMLRKIYSIEN